MFYLHCKCFDIEIKKDLCFFIFLNLISLKNSSCIFCPPIFSFLTLTQNSLSELIGKPFSIVNIEKSTVIVEDFTWRNSKTYKVNALWKRDKVDTRHNCFKQCSSWNISHSLTWISDAFWRKHYYFLDAGRSRRHL